MTDQLGAHAIVVGAGMGGLATAKALSSCFEKVTILERDALPNKPEARPGTPHCQQVHVLLRAGLDALIQLFPEFESELELAGAVRARAGLELLLETPGFDPWPQRDFGFDTFCMSRPLVEFVARRLTQQQRNIEFRSRCRVTQFVEAPDKTAVSSVRYDLADGQSAELAADLVVDASSRGTLTLELLDKLGMPRPEETEIGIDLRYATATFDIPPDAPRNWKAVLHRTSAQSGRGAFLFPIENNRWHVNLNGMHGDAPSDEPTEFVEFAKTLRTSTIFEAIKDAPMIGDIHRFGFPSSIRRRFEAMKEFPGGLLPIGDAICRFNPAFGQGMSVVAQEIGVLKRLLDERAGKPSPLHGLAPAFFTAIQPVLAAPWSVAENDFMFPKTRGQCPVEFPQRMKFGFALQQVAMEDAAVHRVLTEVNNLLIPPTALREPHIVAKVTAMMAASA
jgi:2-polyprenyl-6-methoxyphenol hydroxylase-like FAD-dependent oxidoreductase